MKQRLQRYLFISLGWLCVLLGAIGAILPLLPTTSFLILALFFFSKSSPRFHQLLLHNRLFGPALQQWEASRSVSRGMKKKATGVIVITFLLSIYMVSDHYWLPWLLVILGLVLLLFIWRLNETE
jgi:uncharacterized membrane protein YbaN (DUF454 family)